MAGKKLKDSEFEELSQDYLSEVLIYLYDLNKKDKGPFFRFSTDIFNQKDDSFLMNKLRYYVYRYAERVAKKMKIDLQNRDSIETETPTLGDEGETDFFDAIAAPSSDKESMLDKQHDFFKWLTVRKPRLGQLLLLLDQNVPKKKIYEIMGIKHRQTFDQMIDSLTNHYNKFLKSKGA